MKIVAFGASISKKSINKTLATYVANLVTDAEIDVVDLAEFELPLFSVDTEEVIGQPQAAKDFLARIAAADALVISFAEHNASYTAGYKNLFDWASRIDLKVFQGKPAIYLSASPGKGGAANVLAAAKGSAAYFGADLKASVSIPSFHDVFDFETNRITDPKIQHSLEDAAGALTA
ncbi:NADPH-dependent FMN reductase [Roseibium sp.]|uniref:NADPH-dependent FMN reductase n=1 Tax=Roseibium sp. TaxID=1936156 RepID=UPI003BB084C0